MPFELPDAQPQATPTIPDMPVGGGPPSAPSEPATFQGLQDFGGGDFSGAEVPVDPSQFPSQPAPASPVTPATPATPATPGQVPAVPAQDPLASALAQYGVDVSRFSSPQEAMGALVEMASNGRANQQYADYGRQAVAAGWNPGSPTGAPAQPSPAPTPAPAPEPPQFQWELPQLDQQALSFCTVDEATGRFIPKDPALTHYAQAANAYLDQQRQISERIHSNFPAQVREVASPWIQEMVQERVREALAEYDTQQRQARAQTEAQAALDSQMEKLFQRNEQGQYVTDPLTGQRAYTPAGAYANRIFTSAVDRGMSEIDAQQLALEQLQYAEQSGMFQATPQTPSGQVPAQPVVPQPGFPSPSMSPEQVAAQNRQSFMQEAMGQQLAAQRDGTIPDTPYDPPQDPRRPPTAEELVAQTINSLG